MYEFRTRCSVADHYLFFFAGDFHYKPSATSEDSAAMPGSQEMSQDESGTPTTLGMAATLATEAELKAWYLANNPTLRSQGLSCPKALYEEMQRDLRYFNTMVAIIPVIDSDDIERIWSTSFLSMRNQTM